jgi:Zn-dependent protease/CBS domain-containing protein
MRWSWRIATFNGISLRVHATFALFLAWIVLAHLAEGHDGAQALLGVTFALLLFGCVVLHEFGHAITAQCYGIQTRDITLYPIGGVARLERIPRDPRQELWIALAGPAVNGLLAAIFFAGAALTGAVGPLDPARPAGGSVITTLMWANLILAGFNLLPAFPMDGGRVLRAFLAQRMEYGHATRVAASVGQTMAYLFGLAGLLLNPLLLFIALFVYVGAAEEAATVQAELAFRGVPVRDAMVTHFATLSPGDPLARAVQELLAGDQHDFPVAEGGRVVGLLPRGALVQGLAELGPQGLVRDVMQPAPRPVEPTDSLEITFQRMREAETPVMAVVDGSDLIGLLTLENIGEFLLVRAALQPEAGERQPARAGRRNGPGEPIAQRGWAAWLAGGRGSAPS